MIPPQVVVAAMTEPCYRHVCQNYKVLRPRFDNLRQVWVGFIRQNDPEDGWDDPFGFFHRKVHYIDQRHYAHWYE